MHPLMIQATPNQQKTTPITAKTNGMIAMMIGATASRNPEIPKTIKRDFILKSERIWGELGVVRRLW
jgi:hypothetical protein